MMKRSTESDNWGQLLSDFGIEETASAEQLVDPVAEVAGPPSEPKEKKSNFSRFPKVDFFGVPPEMSLDSVAGGVKSPSLGGTTFTDNRLEKMPLSKEWADRQEEKQEKNVTAPPDAFSAVASQIDSLASGKEVPPKSSGAPAKRHVTSIFDDPIPESEEVRKLKTIMGEHPSREDSRRDDSRREGPRREEPRRNAFHDDETNSWQRGGRDRQKPQPIERETRGRGSRYRPLVEVDDLPVSDFEPMPMDDDVPRTRERGQRGSRYSGNNEYRDREREPIREDVPQEEWSEVDAALQGRSERTQRGGRRRRSDRDRGREPEPMERSERPAFDREDMEEGSAVATHWNVPNWDDAIGDIVAANIARHKSHSGRGRR